MKTVIALLVAAGLTATHALAEDCGQYNATNDQYQCFAREYAKADAALNEMWASIRSVRTNPGLSDAFYNTLVEAQRVWIQLRDLDCKAAGLQMEGGSFEKVLRTACLVEKTKERTKFLHDMVFGMNE